MKKIHIALIAMLCVAVFLFFKSSTEMSTYGSFQDAHDIEAVKVVGVLSSEPDIYYEPEENPNFFSFYMEDMNGIRRKVVLKQSKPNDFERSDQIVVSGRMEDDVFMAEDILLKCPSKYKDEELFMRSEKASTAQS